MSDMIGNSTKCPEIIRNTVINRDIPEKPDMSGSGNSGGWARAGTGAYKRVQARTSAYKRVQAHGARRGARCPCRHGIGTVSAHAIGKGFTMDDNPYSIDHVDEYYSYRGTEGAEVRLWHENGDLVAVAYAVDFDRFSGYQTPDERGDVNAPLYNDWRDCLSDQLDSYDKRTRDYKHMIEAIG
jgi:hypothetical protein